MKVLLIGNLAEDRQESMIRFAALLPSGLASRGREVTVLAPTLDAYEALYRQLIR